MSDNPQGVFIDDVEFPFDDSTSVLEFSNKSLGEKIIPTLCDDDNLRPYAIHRLILVCESIQILIILKRFVKTSLN